MTTASEVLAEGKTKVIHTWPQDPSLVRIYNKDDLTAGDGAKHDVFDRKAVHATDTTCNVFELLQRQGVRTAFVRRLSKDEFLARRCAMIPFEVVTRRIALGSYLKRHPETEKGKRFGEPRVEFYLKSNGKTFNGVSLPKDDPIVSGVEASAVVVHDPSIPTEEPGLRVPLPVGDIRSLDFLDDMHEVATRVFLILEEAWAAEGMTLADMKIEFGFDENGVLLVADVIDNDSWRVLTATGEHLDKQLYRDGADLETVAKQYERVAALTKRFLEPA